MERVYFGCSVHRTTSPLERLTGISAANRPLTSSYENSIGRSLHSRLEARHAVDQAPAKVPGYGGLERSTVRASQRHTSALSGRDAFEHGLDVNLHAIDTLFCQQAVIVVVECPDLSGRRHALTLDNAHLRAPWTYIPAWLLFEQAWAEGPRDRARAVVRQRLLMAEMSG